MLCSKWRALPDSEPKAIYVGARAVRCHVCAVYCRAVLAVQIGDDDPVTVGPVGLSVAVPAAVGELCGGYVPMGPLELAVTPAVPAGLSALVRAPA